MIYNMMIYKSFKDKELLLDVPTDFNPNIYKSLYNDTNKLIDEKMIKYHYIYKGYFEKRLYGTSKWNFNCGSKIKFIIRTIKYSINLLKSEKHD